MLTKEVQAQLQEADEEGNLEWWQGILNYYRGEVARLEGERARAIGKVEQAKRKIAELTGQPQESEVCWFCTRLLAECNKAPCEAGKN